ncbi:protein artichoke [Rhagoletis pomonella]|uniref:protein artichoke n=1 Tax=Rhagoletis pomonella TaxID=28610 RepID=UPI00178338EC|nr:protein artichoke [Rhagoletis pomonella]
MRFNTLLLALCLLALYAAVRSQDNVDAADESNSTEESIELNLLPAEENNYAPPKSASAETSGTSPETQTQTTNTFEASRPRLRNIKTLDNHCIEYLCIGFHYERPDEVAFFDIKDEVRINGADATYDIVNARNYDTLIFENSTFARFPLNLFYAISMSVLDMRNCSVQVLTWECFLMAQNLRGLILSENRLQAIEPATFKFASELHELFLDSNRLTQLHRDSFEGLSRLRYLDLRHNRLTLLPMGVFDHLAALEELLLDDNRLRTLNDQLFLNNLNMWILSVGENRLLHIDENTLRRQARLVILNIGYNNELRTLVLTLQLQHLVATNCALERINIYGHVRNADLSYNHIQELYFAQPEQLEMLNLRNNSLQQIASLSRATNLKLLDLGDNPQLGTLPTPWLANALERLDLGNTGLAQLPVEAIAAQEHLNFLNVSYNRLREINPQNFKYLEHLSHFDIRGNEWNCYNLNILMDVLLKPLNIIYGYDKVDPEFPGEYVNDIACMYRLEGEQEEDSNVSGSQLVEMVNGQKLGQPAQLQALPLQDAETFRRELKAIVGIYEQKFDRAFRMIEDLNARLRAFERFNETLFQHATITV